MSEKNGPLFFERWILALTVVAAIALAAIRVNSVDTPWHLATARHAFATGQFPVTNTFSHTFPDYPLYQQYPFYQSVLYLTYLFAGWEGLSVLHCLGWVGIFLLWIRWGSSWREAAVLHLPWMFCLWCLQQRMVLRPDLATCLLFLCLLHAIDHYRSGSRWAWLLFPPIQLLMANSHQLFTVGLATQAIFIIHLLMVRIWGGKRFGIADSDRAVPIWPAAIAWILSLGACMLTPLGTRIIEVSRHTAGSLFHHRDEVQEFAPFYSSGWVTFLVLVATAIALMGMWRSRKCWQPWEIGLWLMGAALVAAAMRGLVFFGPLSVGLFARVYAREQADRFANQPADFPTLTGDEPVSWSTYFRLMTFGTTLGLCVIIFHFRWIHPPRTLGGTQPGLGRSLGDWPDHAMRFLQENPPPGKMLNLGWYSGNALVWGLFPQQRVFVDPRFEAYPRDFLTASIQSEYDDAVLAKLIADHDPQWLVAEVRLPDVMKRTRVLLDSGEWKLVHADTNFLVLVRNRVEHSEYLNRHAFDRRSIDSPDWLRDHPDLLDLQQKRMATAMELLGAAEGQ